MAITGGYNRYACDVKGCPKKIFAAPNTDTAAEYITVKRLDANQQTREYVLCSGHASQWHALMEAHDAEANNFISSGELPKSVKLEV